MAQLLRLARYTGDLPLALLAGVDEDVAVRFEAKVDRSGEHYLSLGAPKPDGSGTFKAGGTSPVMARKVAWELVTRRVGKASQRGLQLRALGAEYVGASPVAGAGRLGMLGRWER